MIKTLSTYNYYTPWVSAASGLQCQKYRLELFIWNGAKAGAPSSAQESFTKNNTNNLGGVESDVIAIHRILADYIESSLVNGSGVEVLDGNAQWWVKTQVVYFTNPTFPDTGESPQYVDFQLFGRGYNYGMQAENNTSVPGNIALTGREFKVNRQGVFIVPYYSPTNTFNDVTIDSFPSGEITQVISKALAQERSEESTQYVWIDISLAATDKYIEVTQNKKMLA